MKCKTIYSRRFILESLSKNFLEKKWKPHQKKMLVNRELSILQTEQSEAIDYGKVKARYQELVSRISELHREKRRIKKELKTLSVEHGESLRKVRDFEGDEYDPSENTEKREFVQPCSKDLCSGYLTNQWKCPVCENFTCNHCLEFIGDSDDKKQHTCDTNALKNTETIRKDSKKCPKCGVFIYKIEGCDVMFCTFCKTSFWWRNLKIMTNGQYHNPHYYEYVTRMRHQGHEQVYDMECEGPITPRAFENALVSLDETYGEKSDISNSRFLKQLGSTFRCINEISDYRVGHYRTQNIDTPHELRIARWKYLNKMTNQKQFETRIYNLEKKTERNYELIQILEMFCTCGTDIIRRFLTGPYSFQDNIPCCLSAISELEELRVYADTELAQLCQIYSGVPRLVPYPIYEYRTNKLDYFQWEFNRDLSDRENSKLVTVRIDYGQELGQMRGENTGCGPTG